MQRFASAFLIAVLLVVTDCVAQTRPNPDEVLVESKDVKLTRADYQLELLRVPEEMRAEFAANPKRLTTLLNQVLVDKTLAKQARDQGLDRDPDLSARLAHEIDRFYAQAEVAKMEADAGADFDAHASDYLPKAREIYLLDKAKYRTPEEVSASHILFEVSKRGDAAALAAAKDARARLVAGADFGPLARELSDDPSALTNNGALGWFAAGKMDPVFSKAAFDLKNVGDISEPVLTRFGYHIIRLDGRHPAEQKSFEKASKQIMAELRERHIKQVRDARIEAIETDRNTKVNQAAIDALVVKLPTVPKVPKPQAPAIQ